MRVVVAIPTIEERPGLADYTAVVWDRRTLGATVECIQSTAGSTWAAGLNDIARQVADDPPAVFVCGSDDMQPDDDGWLPAVLPWLDRNLYPAPRVDDPRFQNFGGHPFPVPDGTPSDMSTFPILRGDWLDTVFPLPENLHYYSDNLVAVLLAQAGVGCVAVPTCRIRHLHAREGRGAGYGSENTRLFVDSVRYSRELERRGIDRAGLPEGARGGLWEPHFQQQGVDLGA